MNSERRRTIFSFIVETIQSLFMRARHLDSFYNQTFRCTRSMPADYGQKKAGLDRVPQLPD